MRRSARDQQAGVKDVAEKIYRHFRDLTITKQLVERVQHFLQTKNDRDDLDPEAQRSVYRDYNYGQVLPLTKHRRVDVGWTDHAEYRSDLRDVAWQAVNESIRDWLHERLVTKGPDAKSVRMKLPGTGTAVVDYDLRQDPARAKVITVWAGKGNAMRLTAAQEAAIAASVAEAFVAQKPRGPLLPPNKRHKDDRKERRQDIKQRLRREYTGDVHLKGLRDWLLERIVSAARVGVAKVALLREAAMWEYDQGAARQVIDDLVEDGLILLRGGKLWPDPDVVRQLVSHAAEE